jgi:hypothetical protein
MQIMAEPLVNAEIPFRRERKRTSAMKLNFGILPDLRLR